MSDQKFLKAKGIPQNFSNIQWRTQESNKDSLLFIRGSKKSLELVLEGDFLYSHIITDCEDVFSKLENVSLVASGDFISCQKYFLDSIYPFPKNKKMIAVTGTNGKTTVTSLLEQALRLSNKKVLFIGTLGIFLNNKKIDDLHLTTPSYIDLRKILFNHKDEFEFVCLEASSHALEQERFFGMKFDGAAWTNLSQDHLDYHKTLESYFEAKKIILNHTRKKELFILASQKELEGKLEGSGKIKLVEHDQTFIDLFANTFEFKLHFNQENLLLAKALADFLLEEISWESISKKLHLPVGRVERIKWSSGRDILIDFAHTPDALRNVTQSLRKTYPQRKLITLFGCGGDRDRTKRSLMLEAVLDSSFQVYLTSDNPRTENPEQIMQDVLKGRKIEKVVEVVERREAIKLALSQLPVDSILLVAGKGHENYTLINGNKIPYSDKEEVLKIIHGQI